MHRITQRAALVLAAALFATTTLAHSTAELSELLGEREKHFQAFDRQTPDFILSDAEGRTYRLEDFRWKVTVVNFVCASCPDIYPLHSEKLAEVQEMVNQTPMKDLAQFISITSDPATDTPEVLRAYASAHGFDPANWIFLTTTIDQPENATRKLLDEFYLGFDETQDGAQSHGVVMHVINMTGSWRANFHGLKFVSLNMVLFLNALTNESAKPHGGSEPDFWDGIIDLFN